MCCHDAPFTCEQESSYSAGVARRAPGGMRAANLGISWPRPPGQATGGLTENGEPYSYGMVEFGYRIGKIV